MKRIQLLVGTMLALAGASYGLDGTWNADISTNWGAGPWAGGVPNGIDEVAAFTNNITANRTVTNEIARTIGALLLGDNTGNNGGFTILGSPLTFDVTAGMALISKRFSTLADTIAADLVLNDDLTISNGVNGGAAAALIISGGMSGAYNVQKTGSGWLILDGNNTFGSLLISAGTVQVGRATTSGTLGYGPVTNNAMLQFFRTDDLVVTNNVLGSGVLRQLNGSGSVTLLGSNTLGSLLLGSGRLDSALILGAGSTNLVTGDVQLGVLGGTGLGQYGRLVVSPGATLRAVNMYLGNASGSTGEVYQAGGAVSIANQFRVGHYPNNTSTYTIDGGTFQITSAPSGSPFFTSGSTESNGTLYVGIDGTGVFRQNGGDVITAAIVLDNRGATAGTDLYTLAGGNLFLGQWGVQGNAAVGTTRFDAGGGSLISSNNLTITVPFHLTNITGVTKISVPAGGFVTLSNAYGQGSAIVTNGTLVLANTAAGRNVLGGDLTLIGGGDIRQIGSGTTFLGGKNTANGVVVSNGTLGFALDASVGGAAAPITVAGGLLQVDGTTVRGLETHAVNWSTFNGGIDVASPFNMLVITTNIDGTGSFTKAGPGRLVLMSADHTYSGGTSVSNGWLRLAGGNDPLNTAGDLTLVRGTLDLAGNTQTMAFSGAHFLGGVAQDGAITASGTDYDVQAGVIGLDLGGAVNLVKSGPGMATLLGSNTFSGGNVTLNSGILSIVQDANLGAAGNAIVFGGGGGLRIAGSAMSSLGGRTVNYSATATNAFDIAMAQNTFTVGDLIGGSSTFGKLGAGTLVLTAANNYSGATLIGNGTLRLDADQATTGPTIVAAPATLQLGNGGAAGMVGTGDINNSGLVRANRSDVFTLSNVIAGNGSFQQTGSGTVIIASNVTVSTFFPKFGTTVITNNGVVQATSYLSIGQMAGDNARVVVNGSGILRSTGDFNVSDLAGSRGSLYITDSAVVTGKTLYVGKLGNAVGTLFQDGGMLTVGSGNDIRVGGGSGAADAAAYGYIRLSGGLMTIGNNFQPGAYGVGAVDITGGVLSNLSWNTPGRYAGSFGLVNFSGGIGYQYNTGSGYIVGEQGTGQLEVNNATILATGRLRIGGSTTGTGTVNLASGGLMAVQNVETLGGQGFLNFHGGTLRLQQTGPTNFQGLARTIVWSEGGAMEVSNNILANVRQNIEAPSGNGLTAIAIADAGSGYVGTPFVRISGGGGTGATAVAEVDLVSGVVTNIRITNPGVGYVSAPTIAIYGGGAASGAYAGTVTLGVVAGTGGALVKTGAGMLSLLGTNTYSGGTLIQNGLLAFGAPESLPVAGTIGMTGGGLVATGAYGSASAWLASGKIATNAAGSIVLTPALAAENIDLSTLGGGNYTNLFLGATPGANLLYTGTLTPAAGGNYRLGGGGGVLILADDLALTGAGRLTVGNFTGADTVVWLSGSNTYAGGTTVDGSILSLATQDNVGTSTRLDLLEGGVQVRGGTLTSFAAFTGSQTNFTGNIVYDIANIGNTFTENRDLTGAADVTKRGQGTLVLGGSNAFAGAVTVTNGVLKIQNGAALGGAGTNTTVLSGAALQLQGGITMDPSDTLSLNGTGFANDGALRNLTGSNTWTGPINMTAGTRINSDAGTLNLASNVFMAGTAGQSYYLGGEGNILVSGVLGGAGHNMYKDGAGIVTLVASNTENSFQWVVNAGTLAVDFSAPGAPQNNIIGPSKGLTLGGGAFNVIGAAGVANTQNLWTTTGLTINPAASAMVVTSGAGGSMVVNLNGINRAAGSGVVDFILPASGAITTTNLLNTTGIFDQLLTVAGVDWATKVGTAITNYTGYAAVVGSVANDSLTNSRINAGSSPTITLAATVTSNKTILVNDPGVAHTVNLAGGALVLGNPGAILLAKGAADFTVGSAVNDGYLQSGGELVLINYATNLTINSAITNAGNALTINGAGSVFLNGTNRYTGATYANGPAVTFGNTNVLGAVNLRSGSLTFGAASSNALGAVTVNSGTLTVSGPSVIGGNLILGNAAGDRGVAVINADVSAALIGLGSPAGSAGALYLNSGNVRSSGEFDIGYNSTPTAYGYMLMSGGTVSNGSWFQVGRNGVGVMDMTGGSINPTTANSFLVGNQKAGVLRMTGGTVNGSTNGFLNMVWVAGARAEWTIDGSALVISRNALRMNANGVGTSILNLNGGTLSVNSIYKQNAGGLAVFNFDGGILTPATNAATLTLMGTGTAAAGALDAAYVYGGGAIIDVSDNTVAINQSLLGVTGYGVTNIPVADGGAGYIGAPAVQLLGGSGTGATAIAQIDANGVLTNILITSTGSGYLPDDVLNIQLLGGGYTRAATLGVYRFGQNANTGGLIKLGTGTLSLGGNNSYGGLTTVSNGALVFANAGGTNLLAGGINGPGALSQNGPGTTILGGDGIGFSGVVSVNDGLLQFATTSAMPRAASSVTIGGGGAVAIDGPGIQGVLNNWQIAPASAGALALTANTANENIDFSTSSMTALSLGAVGTVTYGGTLTPDPSGYRLGGGGGTLIYTNAITTLGLTVGLNAGLPSTVQVPNLATNLAVTVNARGILDLAGSSQALGSLAGDGMVANRATNAVTLTVGSAGSSTFGGLLAGNLGLTKTGAGTLALTNASTYLGATVIDQGTLRLAPATNAGPVFAGLAESYTNARTMWAPNSLIPIGVTSYPRFAETNMTGVGSYPPVWPTVWPNTVTIGYSGYLCNNTGSNVVWSFASNMDDASRLLIDGVQVLTSAGNNSAGTNTIVLTPGIHLFDYRIENGTGGAGSYGIFGSGVRGIGFGYDPLGRASTSAADYLIPTDTGDGTFFSTGFNILPAATVVSIATNAVFDLNGAGQLLAGLSDYNGGGGSVTNSAATPAWLTLNPLSGTTTFGGNIDDDGTVGTGIALYKTGAGTQTLTGSNTYAGGTFVLEGVLRFGAADAVSPDSKVTVLSGGTAALDFTGANAVLGRISGLSSGSVAVTATSAGEALNFSAASLSNTYLGAVGNVTYTGALTPFGTMYRLGGGAGVLDYAPQISGANSLAVGGGFGGIVSLTNANSYTGGTVINNGILRINADAALGTAPGTVATNVTFGYVFNNGLLSGVLQAGANGIALNANRTILVAPNAIGTVDVGANTMTISGNIDGAGGTLAKTGAGVLRLGGVTNNVAVLAIRDGVVSNVAAVGFSSNIVVAAAAGDRATLDLAADLTQAGRMYVGSGAGAAGAVIQHGGAVNIGTLLSGNDVLSLGNNGGYGYYRLESGILNMGQLAPGGNSAGGNVGVYEQYGGTATVVMAGGWIVMGWTSSSNGVLNLWGGQLNSPTNNNVTMGFTANINTYNTISLLGPDAVFNTLGGGTARAIQMMSTAGNQGSALNLNDGLLLANQITQAVSGPTAGLTVFNFGGGTLRANAGLTQPAFLQGLSGAYVYDGGAIIDTSNSTIGVQQALLAPIGYGMTNIALVSGGAGYVGAPVVRIVGGSGTGATAVAEIDLATGSITNIHITSAGSGYLPTDTLWITLEGGGATTPATLGAVGWDTNSALGGLVKLGTGTLMLGGDSTYLGGTVVSNGHLQIGMGAATGSVLGALTFVNPASTLAFNRTDTITNSYALVTPNGNIASLIQNGRGGTLVLTNAAPQFNTVVVNTGNVLFASTAAIPGAGATITNNLRGAVVVDGAYTTVGGWLASGRIATNAAGALALTGSTAENIDLTGYPTLSLGAAPGVAATYLGTLTPGSGAYYLGGGGGQIVLGADNQLVDNGRTNRSLVVGNGGGGIVTILGPNTYNGGTTINNGTLQIEADNALGYGPLTLNAAGTMLQISNAPTFASTRLLGLNTGGGTVTLDVGAGSTAVWYGVLSATGAGGFVHKQGGGVLILSNATYNGDVSLFEKNGLTIIDSGAAVYTAGRYHNVGHAAGDVATLTIRGTGIFTNNGDFNIADVGGAGTLNVQDSAYLRAATFYVGKAGTGTANLSGGDVYMNGNAVIGNAAGSVGTINQTGGTLSVGDLRFAVNATAATTNNLNGGVQTVRGTQLARVWQPTNTGSAVMTMNGGTLRAGNNFVISNLTALSMLGNGGTIDPSNYTVTVNQLISGAGRLTVAGGTGTVFLSGSGTGGLVTNSYTGGTVVNNGVLRFGTTATIGGTGRTVTNNFSGTVAIHDALGPTNLLTRLATSSGGTVALVSNTEVIVDLRGNALSNVSVGAIGTVGISGNTITNMGTSYRLGGGWGTLILSNGIARNVGTNLIAFGSGSGGILRLLGTNRFDNYTVNGGLVQFAQTNAMGSFATDRPVIVNRGGSVSATGAVIAAEFLGRIATGSSGTVALIANNAGALDFNAAGLTALSLGAANGSWTNLGAITPLGGTYRLGGGEGTLVLTNRNQLTGANSLVAFGGGSGGALVLANTNDFSGGTLISPTGTVRLISILGLGTGPVMNNGTLVLDTTTTAPYPGIISGVGSVTKTNTGTVIVTNAWTHTGGTAVLGGTLVLSNVSGNALSGRILIGDTVGSDAVKLNQNNQIDDASVLTFNSGGSGNSAFLQLNGYSETVGGIIATNAGQAPVIEGIAGTSTLTVNNGAASFFDGYIRDQGGKISLVKDGAGPLTLVSANITYTGPTTINGGVLMLSNTTAFASGTTINDGHLLLGTQTAAQNVQITNNAENGLSFGTMTNAYTIGALNGTGDVALLSGIGGVTLTLGNNNQSGSYLGSLTDAGAGNYYMASIVKVGSGTQALVGANSYHGSTTISAGGLLVDEDASLGAAGTPVILNGGTLLATNSLTLGDRPIAVTGSGGRFGAATNMTMTLTNSISGTGTLAMNGLGTLVLAGDNSDFTGNWSMMSGIVRVTHSYGLGAWGVGQVNDNIQGYGAGEGHALELSGGITVSGKVLYTSGSGYTAGTGVLRNLDGTNQWLAPIILTGGAGGTTIASDSGLLVLGGSIAPNTGTRTLTFAGAGSTLVQGSISNGSTVNMPLFMNGPGTLLLANSNAYSGATRVLAGALELTGGGAISASTTLQIDAGAKMVATNVASTMHLASGQTLKGEGTFVGGLIADSGSTVAPGASPGILNVSGNWQMDAESAFNVELNGLVAGSEYDQLLFNNNTLTLNNPTLNIALGFAPNVWDSFTIISGLASAASGTFSGLPDGAIVTNNYAGNDYELRINYNDAIGGGDPNNDVTLTVVPEPAAFGLIGLGVAALLLRRRMRA